MVRMERFFCTKCGQEKPRNEFHKRSLLKKGVNSWCRECLNTYAIITRNRYRSQNAEGVDESGTRICSRCGKEKLKTSFYRDRGAKGGFEPYCKECHKDRQMLLRVGIDQQGKKKIFEDQDSMCSICGRKFKSFKGLRVDHLHGTQKIRGLLCHACNVGLGHFKDSSELLRKAADYVDCSL